MVKKVRTPAAPGQPKALTPEEKISNELEIYGWVAQNERKQALDKAHQIADDLRRAADELERDVESALFHEGRTDTHFSPLAQQLTWAANLIAQRAGQASAAAVDLTQYAWKAHSAEEVFRSIVKRVQES